MILSRETILDRMKRGTFGMTPFDPERNIKTGNFLELHLSLTNWIEIPKGEVIDTRNQGSYAKSAYSYSFTSILKERAKGLLIMPGYLYLFATQEHVSMGPHYGEVLGKSSLARLGLAVHVTAGAIDSGFSGHITLEVSSIAASVRLHHGAQIAQLALYDVQRMPGENAEYYAAAGKYNNPYSPDPWPGESQYWRNFEDEQQPQAKGEGQ